MMDTSKASEELKVIRELMERPIKYSTQSGLAGIIAGLAALGGLGFDIYNSLCAKTLVEAIWWNMLVWLGVLVVAIAGVLIMTRIREKKRGMPLWSNVKTRILRTILPPFVAGVGLTFAIIYQWYRTGDDFQWYLIPAIWMLFYGVACWQVGEFSVPEIRVLGIAFILAGLCTAMFFQTRPYMALGITFGGFHLIYGTIVSLRHGG